MTFVSEIIVAAILRSLCFLHFNGFHLLQENLPKIIVRFHNLHPGNPVIRDVISLFPPYPATMTIQRWEALHAWATDLATSEEFGECFYHWTAYAINAINHCPHCQAYSTPNTEEAIRLRNDQVFFSSLATLDRRTIVNTARNYPSCANEYMDNSRFTGEYHRMEMSLKKTRRKLSRCRERVAEQSQTIVEIDAERHELRQQVIDQEIRIEQLIREVGQLLRHLTWGPSIAAAPHAPNAPDEQSGHGSNAGSDDGAED